MKKGRLIALILLSFVILTANAKADFTITQDINSNSVCPSSTIVIEDIIMVSESGAFTTSISGTASSFTTAVPNGFWLDSGQSQAVYLYITPSSRVSPGTYTLELTVAKGNNVKTARHNILVNNCHKTVLEIEPVSQSICACEQNSIFLKLMNQGNYIENYQIDVEGQASNWINVSRTLTLSPNSTSDLTASILAPCNVAGNYEINFVARGKSEYARTNSKASVSVLSCYDYSISTEKTFYNICEAEKLAIPVKIKNAGTKDNNYRINLDSPKWVSADMMQIMVAKDSEASFNLIANPPYNINDSFDVNVEVMNELGKVLKKQSLQINVEKCYDVAVSVEKEKDKMCNALTNTYSVDIRNTGKFLNNYDILLEAPEWVSISDRKLVLNASQEKALTLDVHPPFNLQPKNYTITVKAVDALSKAEASDAIIIDTITIEDCYKPAINTEKESINVARDNSATALFIIENKGTKDANYSIEISGTATKFSQINPGAITVQASKAQTVYLYIAPPLETQQDNYTLTVTARLKDTTILASKTIKINVLEKSEEEQDKEPETKPVEKEITPFMKFINWIVNLFKPEIATPSNITNLINATAPANFTNATSTNITANQTQPAANITATGNKAPILKKQIPDVNLNYGQKQSIDLSQYFIDLDNDALTYSAVKPLNISLTILNSTATIEAQAAFNGTREIIFYAYDGKDINQSNTVKINVGAVQQTNKTSANETSKTISTSEFVSKYKAWIIVSIIVVIIVIILLTGLGKKIIDFFEEEVEEKK